MRFIRNILKSNKSAHNLQHFDGIIKFGMSVGRGCHNGVIFSYVSHRPVWCGLSANHMWPLYGYRNLLSEPLGLILAIPLNAINQILV